MRIRHVTILTCEGCGEERQCKAGWEPDQYPEHQRKGHSMHTGCKRCHGNRFVWTGISQIPCECQRYTEERCVQARVEEEQAAKRKYQEFERKRAELAHACSMDKIFTAVCNHTQDDKDDIDATLDHLMNRVADRLGIDIECLTGDSSCAHEDFRRDCIAEARRLIASEASAKLTDPEVNDAG